MRIPRPRRSCPRMPHDARPRGGVAGMPYNTLGCGRWIVACPPPCRRPLPPLAAAGGGTDTSAAGHACAPGPPPFYPPSPQAITRFRAGREWRDGGDPARRGAARRGAARRGAARADQCTPWIGGRPQAVHPPGRPARRRRAERPRAGQRGRCAPDLAQDGRPLGSLSEGLFAGGARGGMTNRYRPARRCRALP